MGFVKDTFFGGASKKAAQAAQAGLESGQEFIRTGTEEARQDLFRLFPQAQQSAQQGFQGGLDVFGQALPQQAQAFQSGNIAAQQALLAGQPQFQNAILGLPTQQFQPQQAAAPDLSFLQSDPRFGGALSSLDPSSPIGQFLTDRGLSLSPQGLQAPIAQQAPQIGLGVGQSGGASEQQIRDAISGGFNDRFRGFIRGRIN